MLIANFYWEHGKDGQYLSCEAVLAYLLFTAEGTAKVTHPRGHSRSASLGTQTHALASRRCCLIYPELELFPHSDLHLYACGNDPSKDSRNVFCCNLYKLIGVHTKHMKLWKYEELGKIICSKSFLHGIRVCVRVCVCIPLYEEIWRVLRFRFSERWHITSQKFVKYCFKTSSSFCAEKKAGTDRNIHSQTGTS